MAKLNKITTTFERKWNCFGHTLRKYQNYNNHLIKSGPDENWSKNAMRENSFEINISITSVII